MDTGALVDIAARACVTAGRYLLERVDRPGDVAVKSSPHDVVTEVDAHAEALIRRELLAACPESTVVGEELGGQAGSGICWYVDPLDGTYNFVRGLPMFCVSIGVTVAGAAVGGCVYDPVRDELYSACAGLLRRNGAPVVPHDDRGTIPLVLTDIPGDAGELELALFTDLLAAAEVRRIGSSALALAHVACGRADVAVNADVYAWDVVAGRALVEAAGGGFVPVPDLRTDRPGGFVAWRGGHDALADRLLKAVRSLPAMR
jgi:myo-inositol-1(or 4)-monophosphatase